jgi:acetoin utilization deacetylase AcuC-like enzyme
MVLFHDPLCLEYGSSSRPEQPARLRHTAPLLHERHPAWNWEQPDPATIKQAALAHDASHLDRLEQPRDFDADTPWFEDIARHAYRAAGCAVAAAEAAIAGRGPSISLMRPPGHHATREQAMGFCYLNHIAIATLHAQTLPDIKRVAVWDFDAHHGNGTEAILAGRADTLFASVHQSPGYPGTGLTSFQNCFNWPVPPRTSPENHLEALRESFDRVIAFDPDLVLVSAGFDAYAGDPITDMTLEKSDFATLGTWLRPLSTPTAAVLEGGYSDDLPDLVDAFLTAWDNKSATA